MRAFTILLALLSCLSPLVGQVQPGHTIVATRLAGIPATRLLDVDPTTGKITSFGRFPADTNSPLALALDPVNGDILLAVRYAGNSLILRLKPRGTSIGKELKLGTTKGPVTDLCVATAGDLFMTIGGPTGGLFRLPRNGGLAKSLISLPRATTLFSFGYPSTHIEVAQSGQGTLPLADPQWSMVDLGTGKVSAGPYLFKGYKPLGLTGMVDLPTGMPRQLFTHDDGSVSLSLAWANPTKLNLTPALPTGGTVAIRPGPAMQMLVLGGISHPYLKALNGYSSPQNWKILAGPLPGDPVAFDLAPPTNARLVNFGQGCNLGAPGKMLITTGFGAGTPFIGNSKFSLRLTQGTPLQPALMVIGTGDSSFLGLPLPFPMPGGCPLYVTPTLLLAQATDQFGGATLPLAIPNMSVLAGVVIYGQWLQLSGLAANCSDAAALRIHP